MKIITCFKLVPEEQDIVVTPEYTLNFDNADAKISQFDAFNGDWQVDTRADRMGVRLLGPRLECRQQSMISEGIALGAVQVPPDGQPIVLLNDRQTIGGYPRLGALAPPALARLAQCLPGQRVRLLPTVQEAAHREHRRLLAAWDA